MKKLIFFVALLLICSQAFAADTWKYKIEEVRNPSLIEIVIRFSVSVNDTSYVSDEVRVMWSDLEGLTNAQKLVVIKGKIKSKVDEYVHVYNAYQGLKQYEGTEVTV